MNAPLVAQTGVVGYLAAGIGYLTLSLILARRASRTLLGVSLTAASGATVLWAITSAFDFAVGGVPRWPASILETARSCGWIVVLLSLLNWVSPARRASWAVTTLGFGICIAAATFLLGPEASSDENAPLLAVFFGRLLLALLGLMLVENVFRNSPQSHLWTTKYLCLGAGGLFAYDFFLYSDALLFRRLDLGLLLARGPANLFVVPLLAIYAWRGRASGPRISISRKFAFGTATLFGAGLYLVAMAGAGYYVREFGGIWGTFLQAVFFFGAMLLLLVPVFSGTFQAYFRVLVEKVFFKYHYDYREEWHRFIETTSATHDGQDLRSRVIQAVCDIVNSPEGALWLIGERGRFHLAASWNVSRWDLDPDAAVARTSSLAVYLEETRWIVILDDYAASPGSYQGLSELPDWLRSISRAWLIVPLVQRDRLYGIMIIGRPRAPRQLGWEDFDILKTVGRQAASILAQQETDAALAEARQFEAFNKRFAFIAHDIKNLVSQLSLILSNAARHRGKADFQEDVIETVRRSVDKLNRMLRELHAAPNSHEADRAVDLAPLLRDIVGHQALLNHKIALDLQARKATVRADEARLKAAIDHLVQNALDAVGENGRVEMRLKDMGEMASVEIEDNGPGMDPEFVRRRLFRPFESTKRSGYGIGVYESNEYAKALGGRLEVVSRPGRGTIMRMCLPRLAAE